jgi:hypothetical protein
VTGPVIGNTGDPNSVGFEGLPPEVATPSKPLRGELVMKDGGSNLGSWYAVFVYADGRLIWTRQVPVPEVGEIVIPWIEQRLTQEGVELLRSGAVPLGGEFENPAQGLPASAWEDPTLRPFVPWRYAACLIHRIDGSPTPSLAVDVLPAEAKDVLRRSPWAGASQRRPCREVTLEDARMLVEILSDAGFEQIGDKREEWASGPGGPWSFWMLADPNGNPPNNTGIEFWVILPDGSWYYLVGW